MDYSSSGARRGLGLEIWNHVDAFDGIVRLRDFRLRSPCLIEFLRGGSNYFFCQCTERAVGSRLASLLCLCYLSCKSRKAFSQLLGNIYIHTEAWSANIPKASVGSSVLYSWKETLHLDFPSLCQWIPFTYASLLSTFHCCSAGRGEQIEP